MDLVSLANHTKPAMTVNSGVPVKLSLVPGIPQEIIFRSMTENGADFIPTGAISTANVIMEIVQLGGFQFVVGPLGKNYPASINQNIKVYGNGIVYILFVDYVITSGTTGAILAT